MPRALVVSLHDLAPPFLSECREFRRRLELAGVTRAALLVVPRWHLREAQPADAIFWSWIDERIAAGDEIVLHGLTHRAVRLPHDPIGRWIATRYSDGEGEFYRLGYLEARDRLRHGLQLLAGRGLRPRGFVAPGWLLSPAARQAATDVGFKYTVRWNAVEELQRGHRRAAPTVVWSLRSRWRRRTSLLWCRAWAAAHAATALVRMAVHPADMRDLRVGTDICALARSLASRREVTTYGELFGGAS